MHMSIKLLIDIFAAMAAIAFIGRMLIHHQERRDMRSEK